MLRAICIGRAALLVHTLPFEEFRAPRPGRDEHNVLMPSNVDVFGVCVCVRESLRASAR